MKHEDWLLKAGYDPEQGYRVLRTIPKDRQVPVLLFITAEMEKDLFAAEELVMAVVDENVNNLSWQEARERATAIILPPTTNVGREFLRFVDVMRRLRSVEGCPWDRQQTHMSLRRYLVEETYEVLEAIDNQDDENLCEELGDVLFQILFHAQIAGEEGRFTLQDICQHAADKMIERHPHVFIKNASFTANEVVKNWENQKNKQKNRKNILEGVPKGLPSLSFACKIQEKTARVGFDWKTVKPVWDKLQEEWDEVREALNKNDANHLEEECGDVLFATVNVLRHLGVEPETALHRANHKFCTRFHYMEQCMRQDGIRLEDADLAIWDTYWNKAKRFLKKNARDTVEGEDYIT